MDGRTFKTIFENDTCQGGVEVIPYTGYCKRIRFKFIKRATNYGFSIFECRIFEKM